VSNFLAFLLGIGFAWILIKASKREQITNEHERYVMEASQLSPSEVNARIETAKEAFEKDIGPLPSPYRLRKSAPGSIYLRYRKIQDLQYRLVKAGWTPPRQANPVPQEP
jgi:hypothetical protein